MQIVPRSFRFVSSRGRQRERGKGRRGFGGERASPRNFWIETTGVTEGRGEGFVTQWKVSVVAWKGVSRQLDRERAYFFSRPRRKSTSSDFFEPVSFEERGAERRRNVAAARVKGPIKVAVSRSKNQYQGGKKSIASSTLPFPETRDPLSSFLLFAFFPIKFRLIDSSSSSSSSPPRGNRLLIEPRWTTRNEIDHRWSFFPKGRTEARKKTGPDGSDENKISRACFSYFGFFSFSFFFPPFAFGESKTAPVRVAEKVMDRALNVGSHGIWDAGTGVWRQSAATGHHLAARTDDDEGERENARVEREETWGGRLSRTAGERNYNNYACGAYNIVHAREETLQGTFERRRARYRQPSSRGKVKVRAPLRKSIHFASFVLPSFFLPPPKLLDFQVKFVETRLTNR